jgi:hypothetical protein
MTRLDFPGGDGSGALPLRVVGDFDAVDASYGREKLHHLVNAATRPIRDAQLELVQPEVDRSLVEVACVLEFANGERIQFRASAATARQALDVVEVRVLRQLRAGVPLHPPSAPGPDDGRVARAS